MKTEIRRIFLKKRELRFMSLVTFRISHSDNQTRDDSLMCRERYEVRDTIDQLLSREPKTTAGSPHV